VLDDADAGAMLTTLLISAFVQTLLDDADVAAFMATLGSDVVLSDNLNMGQGLVDNSDAVDVDGIVEQGTGAAELKCKVIEIGDWDMDAAASHNVAHGLTIANIRIVTVLIQNDTESVLYSATQDHHATSCDVGISSIDSTNVVLDRLGAGQFDNANYDDVGGVAGNRGWVTIWYEA